MSQELEVLFHRIVAQVRASDDPVSCWTRLLDITGQASNHHFQWPDIADDVTYVAEQLERIFSTEPVPNNIAGLYFGLFDRLLGMKEVEGYYISGWTGNVPDALAHGWEAQYFPKDRYISSRLLNSVKHETNRLRQSTADHNQLAVFDYAVRFGAAAVVSKFAALSLGLRLPVYVGFDSGDFACVAN
jgi:hypothetical protein